MSTDRKAIAMPTEPSLEQLEQDAQSAIAQAASAQAAAARARAEEMQRRDERLDTYAREQLESYDAQQLERNVTDARRRLAAAIATDRVWMAIRDVIAAKQRRYQLWAEASTNSSRVRGVSFSNPPGTADPPGLDELMAVAQREAEAMVSAEMIAREQARTAAANGEAAQT